jgi:hypothetical protein
LSHQGIKKKIEHRAEEVLEYELMAEIIPYLIRDYFTDSRS